MECELLGGNITGAYWFPSDVTAIYPSRTAMSHSYSTSTFAIVPPPTFLDASSAPSANYAYERSKVPGEPLLYMSGATRSGWAIYQTEAILDRLNLPELAFLTVDGTENLLPTEGSKHGYTIIDRDRQPQVIAQFHELFTALKADPLLGSDDEYGIYDDDEIAPALARDYVSSNPCYDTRNVAGDEGQSADYLFVYLRSILAVIENARAEGLWAVHELDF
jgi:hypothetical protein